MRTSRYWVYANPRLTLIPSPHCPFEAPQLKVVGLPLNEIFLMKLARASAADIDDMRILWPLVAKFFGSSRVVVEEFYRAFPLEPFDEYLEDFVALILAEAAKK